jgi:hypothetical protein
MQANSAAGRVHYPKSDFLEGNLSCMIGKICKWMGQFLGRIDVEFLDYNRCPLMCEVRRETDGRNTL